jgi:eukaryotic-like serine/threonine-protein kinase
MSPYQRETRLTADRWRQIEDIFLASRDQVPDERAGFIEQACGADAALRIEVESLLAADRGATGFLEPPGTTTTHVPKIETALRAALVDRYVLERELGRGGMATVFLGRDLKHHRAVAVKVFQPELADGVGADRFLREIEIAAGLSHPHILPLFDSGNAGGLLYYVMPLVDGESLRQRLDRERQLPIEEALRITVEVADALAHAHSLGFVHRDIKPENILLSHQHAVVADFGIARAITAVGGAQLTGAGRALGTPSYMSPEQASGDSELDGRSDLYSLGCVLYEMLVGQPPFGGHNAQQILASHVLKPVPPPSSMRPTIPLAVESALLQSLAKDPANRYRTALDFAEALGASPLGRRAESTAVLRHALPAYKGGESQPTFLEAGANLGRYRLLHRIGAGGMGEVWKAHDVNLDRVVAIKLVQGKTGDPATHARFRREAHALSRLSHAGVATIFDFDVQDGVDYLVMEFVPGGTLEARIAQGPLPLEELLRLGAALAEALHEAHQRGILHRDLKPANVVLSEGGLPKILDFGIARLMGAEAGAARLTGTGLILGSLPYMAPEQLMGEADDARTDIYALGVLLFEMATGRRPFLKARREALMFEILSNAAPPVRTLRPDLPDALDQLVAACLNKDPGQRPASADTVGAALRAIAKGTPSDIMAVAALDVIRAIAVLPLRNAANDPAQEYFADAMTEAIISDLAMIKQLRVISRTSAMQYKGSIKPLTEIARELNVGAVLEGSALLVGTRVRLSVQLVTARTDLTLWSGRYDRELQDVFDLQSELAATVAREIAVQLTPSEEMQLAGRGAVNPEAHLEYMKSRHAAMAANREGVELGVRHARRALELDPRHALSWAALGEALMIGMVRGAFVPATTLPEASAAIDRGLELDPMLGEAHTILGTIRCFSGDLVGGIQALERALELNSSNVMVYIVLGRALYALERYEEALAVANTGVRVDPKSALARTALGDAYYFARQHEKSIFHFRMAIELDPRFDGAHTGLARAFEVLGRYDEARGAYEEGNRVGGGVAGPSFGLAHLAAASGDETEARRILAELTEARGSRLISAWGIAGVHACLGDTDETIQWLETALTEHATGMILLRAHPRFDAIRQDPRYWSIVVRAGLAVDEA